MPDNMNIQSKVATTPTTAPKFLGTGNTGPEVTALQKQLAELGLPVGEVDGKFGAQTEGAVKAFQATKGIKADGVVGPETRAALKDALKAVAEAAEAAKPKSDDKNVSKEAVKEAAKKDINKEIMNYPAEKKAAPQTRLEEQQEAAKGLLSSLAQDARLAAIILNPIFAPAALAIATKANARAVVRYETEVPQREFGVIMAEESAKARKEISGLPKAYADFGAAALNTVVESSTAAALAAYEWGAGALTSVAETGADIAESAWEGTKDVAETGWEGAKKGAKMWWFLQTAPVRALGWAGEKLGQGLSWFGNLLGGGSKNLQDVGK